MCPSCYRATPQMHLVVGHRVAPTANRASLEEPMDLQDPRLGGTPTATNKQRNQG